MSDFGTDDIYYQNTCSKDSTQFRSVSLQSGVL